MLSILKLEGSRENGKSPQTILSNGESRDAVESYRMRNTGKL